MSRSRPEETIPVVVTAGQHTAREGGVDVLDLAERASAAALADAPQLADDIERVSFVDALSSSGKSPAAALARRLGLRAGALEKSTVGGNTPQWLVTRAAADIAAGRLQAALIAGAEAVASRRQGVPPPADADDDALAPDEVVGVDRDGASPQEAAVGLGLPAHIYPMLESARARRLGHDHAAHRRWLGELMAPFTAVAATHPHAWFPQERSPAEIAAVGPGNRVTAEPYTLRMNAILNVDQGAALLVTSLAAARRAGVADRAVFVWSGADANDAWFVPSRPRLDASPAIATATGAALRAAGLDVDDLARIELYSCFPIAVQMAADALGLAHDDARRLTVTGGLPYFGGPGNNYTTHGIATLTDRLREEGGAGLATGLGWFATKHAAGVYGATPPPQGFSAVDTADAQRRIDAEALELADTHEGEATVVGATVVRDREGDAVAAPAYLELPDGRRLVAAADPAHLDELADGPLAAAPLVGARVHVAGQAPAYRVIEPPPPPHQETAP